MKRHITTIAILTLLSVLAPYASTAFAGAQDPGDLASCEIPSAKGIPILGNATVTIDPSYGGLVTAAFQMLSLDGRPRIEVIRVGVGVTLGQSPMEIVCEILHSDLTADGGPTLAQQILANLRLSGREIKITKRGIFGCDELPCARPGTHPDFALVPGLDFASALGTVVLYAVK